MKLTSLFHLSLITLAVGLTADLTAAAATVQPNAQSSASASAQAEAKEARARHNASESEPQQSLTFKFKAVKDYGAVYSSSVLSNYRTELTLNKKENFFILANLLKTDTAGLRKLADQPKPIPVPKHIYDAIEIIVKITEQEQTAEKVEGPIANEMNLFSGAMAWYTAYMKAVAKGEIKLGEHTNLNGAIGGCVSQILEKVPNNEKINFLRTHTQLTSIKITTKYGDCDAAQYMFMMTMKPEIFCPQYESLKNLQSMYRRAYPVRDIQKTMSNTDLFHTYISLFSPQSLEEQAQAQSATAATQPLKHTPAQADTDRPPLDEMNPAAAPADPAQPKNILTRAKDFFHTYHLARYGAYALVGAAAIYGGYRLYKHVNMRKLTRYAGNWA